MRPNQAPVQFGARQRVTLQHRAAAAGLTVLGDVKIPAFVAAQRAHVVEPPVAEDAFGRKDSAALAKGLDQSHLAGVGHGSEYEDLLGRSGVRDQETIVVKADRARPRVHWHCCFSDRRPVAAQGEHALGLIVKRRFEHGEIAPAIHRQRTGALNLPTSHRGHGFTVEHLNLPGIRVAHKQLLFRGCQAGQWRAPTLRHFGDGEERILQRVSLTPFATGKRCRLADVTAQPARDPEPLRPFGWPGMLVLQPAAFVAHRHADEQVLGVGGHADAAARAPAVRVPRVADQLAVAILPHIATAFIPLNIGEYRAVRRDGHRPDVLLDPLRHARIRVAEPGGSVFQRGADKGRRRSTCQTAAESEGNPRGNLR